MFSGILLFLGAGAGAGAGAGVGGRAAAVRGSGIVGALIILGAGGVLVASGALGPDMLH